MKTAVKAKPTHDFTGEEIVRLISSVDFECDRLGEYSVQDQWVLDRIRSLEAIRRKLVVLESAG